MFNISSRLRPRKWIIRKKGGIHKSSLKRSLAEMFRFFAKLAILALARAQEDVQVTCEPEEMRIQVTKAVVESNGFRQEDVHLTDSSCVFNEVDEDNQYYVYRVSPLSACGTEIKINGTHVTYNNKLAAGSPDEELRKGQVVIGSKNSQSRQSLAAKLRCVFPVELMVSSAFLPNISFINIPLPDSFGVGSFQASMALFENELYEDQYLENPKISNEDLLYVGVQLLGEIQSDVFLKMDRCWATPIADAKSDKQFELLTDSCPDSLAKEQGMNVTQNGVATTARFQMPVFKFVSYSAVWLHCDLQICVKETCQPTCDARRKRSSGSEEWDQRHLISVGPIQLSSGEELAIEETVKFIEEEIAEQSDKIVFTPFHVAVLGALLAVSVLCIALTIFLCRKPSKA
ncbi:Oidioi.mRNA.OKI2018_I69.chr2.g5995.t1.cds [Oikopleura dioica]|uniref:Oidioi.mRNA.OKI2018_I69.chr2.g5995.t1.cds n=1 Tax=Oikopleura dioica TaxID=34765 RepID=A0ABN7T5A5_OIKDI|nr:Oidioi.mRNA.OKI2018_I69.chr2.g5995.t1.cds [Oikopleura dioica]